jgi:hypothetical protein
VIKTNLSILATPLTTSLHWASNQNFNPLNSCNRFFSTLNIEILFSKHLHNASYYLMSVFKASKNNLNSWHNYIVHYCWFHKLCVKG